MLIRSLLRSWRAQTHTSPADPSAPDVHAWRLGPSVEELVGFHKLVRGRHGLYVANENDRYIGQALIHYGEYSELEWRLLQAYCGPGEVVAEVGANIGAHTVSIAKAVGASGHVVAVEPQRVLFQALCANLSLNCLMNVEAFQCACGRAPDVLQVPVVDYGKRGNFGGIALHDRAVDVLSAPVAVRTLDSLLSSYDSVRLIKIDVEGMEAAVLEGARKTIEKSRPVLYVENDRPAKSKALIEVIAAMGYRMWWHFPRLFNPDNFFGNTHDLYPAVGSLNLLCIHRSSNPDSVHGLTEVVESDVHPLKRT